MREALADDLLPGERGPLHAALARALEADPALSVSPSGVTAELAFHWFAAHNLPAAFSASAQAGAEAMRLAAFAEANAHYERAIELWDGVPEDVRAAGPSLVDLIRSAAEAAHLAGEYDRAAALARRALTLVDADADPMTAALIGERLGRYLWISGNSLGGAGELPRRRRAACRRTATRRAVRACSAPRATCSCCSGAGPRRSRSASRRSRSRAPPARAARRAASSPPCAPRSSYAGALDAGIEYGHEALRIARGAQRRRGGRAGLRQPRRDARLGRAHRGGRGARGRGRGAERDRAGHRPARRPAGQRPGGCACCGWGAGTMPTPRWPSPLDAAVGGVMPAAALAGRALLDALRGRFDESPRRPRGGRARAGERARVDVDRAAGHRARPSSRCGAGDPDEARDAIVAMLDRVEPADEDAFYLTPVSPSARGPPPTWPSPRARRATREAERDACALADDARGARAPPRAP